MLTSKQVDEILARSPLKRYKYFVRTVAREEEVWGLADEEGWLMMDVASNPEESAFLAFPQEEFAEHFRNQAGFENFQVAPIDLYEFLEWLDDMEEDNILIGVFPSSNMEGAVVKAAELKSDFLALFSQEEEQDEAELN